MFRCPRIFKRMVSVLIGLAVLFILITRNCEILKINAAEIREKIDFGKAKVAFAETAEHVTVEKIEGFSEPSATYHVNCNNTPTGKEWDSFKSMVEILNSVGANYTIAYGTVLAWYRDCSLVGNNDLDFSLDFTWFMENLEKLHAVLCAAGWTQSKNFGKLNYTGYEESWKKPGSMKVDLFSVSLINGEYISGITIGRRTYPCYNIQTSQPVHTWNGISFRVPAPIEHYLVAHYSTTWKVKFVKGYKWGVEPFKTDNGRRACEKITMPSEISTIN